MGVDFYLLCGDCREFIDLHKWWIIQEAGQYLIHAHYEPGQYREQLRPEDSPYPFADLETDCKKLVITSDQIASALAGDIPDHQYIHDLTPIVGEFAAQHQNHRMFLICDMGDVGPWYPDQPSFDEWLEIPGPFNFHQYLPRNLIEIEKLMVWEDVLRAKAKDWPFEFRTYHSVEIEAIRQGFEKRLREGAKSAEGV